MDDAALAEVMKAGGMIPEIRSQRLKAIAAELVPHRRGDGLETLGADLRDHAAGLHDLGQSGVIHGQDRLGLDPDRGLERRKALGAPLVGRRIARVQEQHEGVGVLRRGRAGLAIGALELVEDRAETAHRSNQLEGPNSSQGRNSKGKPIHRPTSWSRSTMCRVSIAAQTHARPIRLARPSPPGRISRASFVQARNYRPHILALNRLASAGLPAPR